MVLTFWTTWCEPCQKEMPEIQEAYEKHQGEGLVVLAVNFGTPKEKVDAFMKQMGVDLSLRKGAAGCKPTCRVLMFKLLSLQRLYGLSDERLEYQFGIASL